MTKVMPGKCNALPIFLVISKIPVTIRYLPARLATIIFGLLLMVIGACHKSQNDMYTGTLTAGVGCNVLLINVNPHLTLQPTNLGDFSSTVTAKPGQRVIFSYTVTSEGTFCMDGPVVMLKAIRND